MVEIVTTGNWLQIVSIVGNTFNCATNTKALTCSGGSSGLIAANTFYAQGGTVTGITLGANNDYFEVADSNVFARGGTAFATKFTNSSSTSRVYGFWQSYTPTWGNTGTANSLGNGTLVGEYREMQDNTVEWRVRLDWGNTTTCGNGAQTFSLPIASNSSSLGSDPAACCIDDASVGLYSATAHKYNAASTMLVSYGTVSGAISAAVPFTWTTSDCIEMHGTYKRA
jgi:hypothetical protein